jgi:serine/threonine protein kinase
MKPATNAQRWQQVEEIFHQVMEVPYNARPEMASQLTGGDGQLLNDVLSLLEAAKQSDQFLEDSEAMATNLTEVLVRWQHLDRSRPNSETRSLTETGTLIGDCTEAASQVLLTGRATLEQSREFFSLHRPELHLIDQMGEGAAGIVIKARDTKLDRFVAIKVLHPAWARRMGESALAKEAMAAALSSDHVVRVYELSSTQSQMLFIIMEWIDGPSLREYLSQQSAISPREAARFAIQIASGLAAAQRHNIVHGDIKPANVMLEPLVSSISEASSKAVKIAEVVAKSRVRVDSEVYRAKLMDFGLARRLDFAGETITDNVSVDESLSVGFEGTPAYASPDQLLKGQSATLQSDVWAVGATLYHMLCGGPPYTGRPHAIVRQMQQGPPISPRQVDSRIPRDLESVCMKALSASVKHRYSTAQELVDDLQRFVNGIPVVARPVRWPGRLLRLVQRHPLTTSLLAGLFTALLSGSILSNFFRLRAVDNFEVATKNSQIANEERDNALKVVSLLKSMISSGDANFGNPNVSMIEVLKGLDARLSSELSGKPSIEAEVRSSLGTMFFSIAAYDSAHAQFQKAIELRGSQSIDRAQLEDRIELSNTLRWLYRSQEALDTALQATALAVQHLGKDDIATLQGIEVIAGCYKDLGQLDKAAQLLEQVIQTDVGGRRSLTARAGLSSLLIDQGRNAEAERQLRELIALRQQLGLNDTRESLVLESNLGTALAEQGKIVEAIEIQRICAERSGSILGQTHDLTITAWQNCAETLRRHGETSEALVINQELLQACQRDLGGAHPKSLECAESIILILVRQKQFAEALRLAEETINQVLPSLPPDNDWHQKFTATRCAALTGLGRAEEAIPLYEQVVRHFKSKLGEEAIQVLVHENNFGLALIEAGQHHRAELLYRDIIAKIATSEMPSIERGLKRNLGLALVRSGQHAAAREILEAVYQESISAGEIENAKKCEEFLALIHSANSTLRQ